MDRTLQLIANRFQTSQDPGGGWGYPYKYDGGVGESAPMDCCGLLGLAVGHGRAGNAGQEDAIKDPKIVNGFAAVNKFIGAPIGRFRDVPLQNLYFLWSWERVGVLYDLPTLADKDWFRWGAEGVIANQAPTGEWLEGGGYPSATPVCNTAFALLFLRRSNLVADLTAALKLNPAELDQSHRREDRATAASRRRRRRRSRRLRPPSKRRSRRPRRSWRPRRRCSRGGASADRRPTRTAAGEQQLGLMARLGPGRIRVVAPRRRRRGAADPFQQSEEGSPAPQRSQAQEGRRQTRPRVAPNDAPPPKKPPGKTGIRP